MQTISRDKSKAYSERPLGDLAALTLRIRWRALRPSTPPCKNLPVEE